MHPLVGKIIKSTYLVSLEHCIVDGEPYFGNGFKNICIQQDDYFKVTDVTDNIVTLNSLTSKHYRCCEVPMDYIEDFKVISQKELDSILPY